MESKAFTLIEVLVVMTIIGVLASIVLVSFSGQRERAKLTRAQNFDAQISHGLGAYAVGIWRFEEGSGVDIHDESGFGNDGILGDGTCLPGAGTCPDFVDSGVHSGTNALQFDGTDDYVQIPNVGISSGSFTIVGWAKPSRNEPDGYGTFMGYSSTRRILIRSSDGKLLTQFGGNFNSDKALSANEWSHIVYKYDSTANKEYFYIDGAHDNEHTPTATPNWNSAFKIGQYDLVNYKLNGQIDNVRIYNSALSAMQIQQHFVMSAPAHGIAVKQ
jgi:prepilin-type N-terminal cleavage/methylation domain-containing protein